MLAILLPALIQEAPILAAQIIAILHKQGKITAQEVVDFILSFPAEGGASFFKPAAPALVASPPK